MYINPSATEAVEALWKQPCMAARVRHLHRVVVSEYDEALRPHGLTVSQLDLLMSLLTSEPDTRPIDLARDLHMDRSTLSRNFKRLQDRGLVDYAPGSNARESRVTVTPAGRQAAESAADAWFAAQQSTADRLGDEGVAALELLTRLLTTSKED